MYKLSLTEQQLAVISRALRRMPWEEAHPVIVELMRQTAPKPQEAGPEKKVEAPSEATGSDGSPS